MAASKAWIRVARVLAHGLCWVPVALLALAAFGIGGMDLGANPVERMLHDTGWWGLALLLATLAVTPLRRLLGQPWLQVLRRPLGLYSFFYASLHVVVYAALDRELELGTIWEDLVERPFILVGAAAFGLLAPLAVTSTRGWMRRLGPWWKRLHWLAYAAAGLGVWHFYWLVKRDVAEPLVFAGVLAGLLGWRVWARVGNR